MSGVSKYSKILEDAGIHQMSRGGTFEKILEVVERFRRGTTLDAPSGPGLLSKVLSGMGFRVVSADLNRSVFVPADEIPFVQVDLNMPLPFRSGQFNLIVCGDGLEHLENHFAAFREFSRMLSPGGMLVVATPNYLTIGRRLKFFFSGMLTQPLSRRDNLGDQQKHLRGHINPPTLTRMAYIAEGVGLKLVEAVTTDRKRSGIHLAPLGWLVILRSKFLGKARRHDLFADATFSRSIVMGGAKLVAVFEKG